MLTRSVNDESARPADAPLLYPHESVDLTDVRPGDLWILGADELEIQRIALVLNAEGCHLDIALASPELVWQTDRDILLRPSDTGAPYGLMVETPVVGRVHWLTARRRVGIISDELLDAILDFIWDERPDILTDLRGLPIPRPALGERLAFETAEAQDLRLLEAYQPTGQTLVDSRSVSNPTPEVCASIFAAISSGAWVLHDIEGSNCSAVVGDDAATSVSPDILGVLVRLVADVALSGGLILSHQAGSYWEPRSSLHERESKLEFFELIGPEDGAAPTFARFGLPVFRSLCANV